MGSFWDPGRHQKWPQNRLFAKKEASKQAFKANFVDSAVSLNFCFGFASILDQKSLFFLCLAFASCVFFLKGPTFTIVCILHIESYFFIVGASDFLREKYEKSFQKCDPEQTTKKHQNLDQKSTQNCSKFKPKSQRSAKNVPKNMFLRHPKNVEKKETKKVPKRAFQGARNG